MSNSRFGLRTRNGLVRNIIEGNQAVDLLLNNFPNAAAAYSLRILRGTYTGSAIRVRRSNDNAEQDIGFAVGGGLDTASLLTFVGANNGFVTTWYDQSGNGLNATQTTSANQPRIVGSGVLDTSGGLPALLWTNGQEQRLINASLNVLQPSTTFSVTQLSAATGINGSVIYDSFNNVLSALFHTGTSESPNNNLVLNNGTAITAGASTTNFQLITALNNLSSSVVRINSLQVATGNTFVNPLSGISIGQVRGNPNPIASFLDFSGHISELIIYASNQTSNFTGIEPNILTYYGI
jgi:hypothetical protein